MPAQSHSLLTGTPAELYEQYAVPATMRPNAERLINYGRPRPGERVLDLATGTGIIARLVAPRVAPGGSVVGLDMNPGMLDVARRVAPADAAIEWCESSAQTIPYDDAFFDAVFCQYGLMFFPDQLASLREAWRVLVEDGRAIYAVWQEMDKFPVDIILNRAMAEHLGVPLEQLAKSFSLSDRRHLAELFETAGFEVEEVLPVEYMRVFPGNIERAVQLNVLVYGLFFPWFNELTDDGKLDLIHRVYSSVADNLGPYEVEGQLRMPGFPLYVKARKRRRPDG
jgi:ubiquinone/menaquinone biosynthesis C-methylase UbiE